MFVELWMILLPVSILIVYLIVHYAKQQAFEDGIAYAVEMHSSGILTYDRYEDEDGLECITIKYNHGKKGH
jgi:competence protein ComGC